MAVTPGTLVTHYRVERALGAGGMGEVYLATDEVLGRRVAIKFLSSRADAAGQHQLRREARAAAALDHPGICAIYEVGADPVFGDFIVMQYIEGQTLAARLAQGRLTIDTCLRLAVALAEALGAAHRQGLVHRDIKPQNIMLTASGAPRILDFGLAAHEPHSLGEANAVTTSRVTRQGRVDGTPAYMAPEQVRGELPDARSDLFSLGCVLYQCLTGRSAFDAPTIAELFGQVLHVDPPAPSSHAPGLTPVVDAIVMRLLAKSPADRFQSAEEVLGALRAATPTTRTTLSQAAAMPQSAGRVRPLIAAIATALVLGGSWFGWSHRTLTLPTPPQEARRWFDRGTDAMREGAFATAQQRLREATRLFPSYVQAHARLAEAADALLDEQQAKDEVLRVDALVPDKSRLSPDDRWRLDGARALVLRQFDQALGAYKTLVELAPHDVGRWIDYGRACERALDNKAAMSAYERALAEDSQSAGARLRLGVLQSQGQQTRQAGLAAIDEAVRLFRAASNTEGEMEAMLRKGIVLRGADPVEAEPLLRAVVAAASSPDKLSFRVSAQLELVRLLTTAGRLTEAEGLARAAIDDAKTSGLQPLAANALIALAANLQNAHPPAYEEALLRLDAAIDLAASRGAKRIEMRARAQKASVRVQQGDDASALSIIEPVIAYCASAGEGVIGADAKSVAARALEGLGRYDEAARMNQDVLTFGESTAGAATIAQALDGLAGIAERVGRLPDAIGYRQRLVEINRTNHQFQPLAPNLTNLARLQLVAGQLAAADGTLTEIEGFIRSQPEAFKDRSRRVAELRTLRAAVSLSDAEASHFARLVLPPGTTADARLDNTAANLARAQREFAAAQAGHSATSTSVMLRWLESETDPFDRREMTYWVAAALDARGSADAAQQLGARTLDELGPDGNVELRWRLAAVTASAAARRKDMATAERFSMLASSTIAAIESSWGGVASSYFARPDLAKLRRSLMR